MHFKDLMQTVHQMTAKAPRLVCPMFLNAEIVNIWRNNIHEQFGKTNKRSGNCFNESLEKQKCLKVYNSH